MPRLAFGSLTLKSIAGVVVVAAGAIGIHASVTQASRESSRGRESRVVEVAACDRADDGRGDDHRARRGPRPVASGGLQQSVVVRVPPTVLLRVDSSGRVIAAATNTGCVPSEGDDVFVFRPDGSIHQTTTFDVESCDWSGNFTVPGQFQTQVCRGSEHPRDTGHPHRD